MVSLVTAMFISETKKYSYHLYIVTGASRLLPAPKWDLCISRRTNGKNPKRQTMVRTVVINLVLDRRPALST